MALASGDSTRCRQIAACIRNRQCTDPNYTRVRYVRPIPIPRRVCQIRAFPGDDAAATCSVRERDALEPPKEVNSDPTTIRASSLPYAVPKPNKSVGASETRYRSDKGSLTVCLSEDDAVDDIGACITAGVPSVLPTCKCASVE